ncbi:MAG: hypothetical protein MN733_36920 [Nitrososphaera sp.]|nr:hypothetical protein [Nitrososphaera sp.]
MKQEDEEVAKCPQCEAEGTFLPPNRTDPTKQVVEMDFACPKCGNRWTATRPLKRVID